MSDVATRPALVGALAGLAGPSPDADLCRLLELPEPPDGAAHTDVFVLETHPYASVHLSEGGMIGGDAGDRVAGFWRALGLVPPAEPDRLDVLLGLYAQLGGEESCCPAADRRRAAIASARAALLWEHLAPWLWVHLASVWRVGDEFHRAWAELVADALGAEADVLPVREELPTALATAPPSLDVASRSELVSGVLAPVRSGMVVTRSDLARVGADLGLGVRWGERRFALEALLDQDPAATLSWLGGLAGEWAALHARWHPGALAPVGRWWQARAEVAAGVLSSAAARVAA